MKNDLENPFADYGRIVSSERFIGRQADLQAIENRTIRPSAPGNMEYLWIDFQKGQELLEPAVTTTGQGAEPART